MIDAAIFVLLCAGAHFAGKWFGRWYWNRYYDRRDAAPRSE